MKLSIRMPIISILLLGLAAMPAAAQPAPNPGPLAAELSIPFGTVTGKLLLLGDYLVFLDEQQPETSIVIPKGIVDRLTADGAMIAIETKEPVRGRAGGVRVLNFRVSTGGDPAAVTAWFASAANKPAPPAPPAPPVAPPAAPPAAPVAPPVAPAPPPAAPAAAETVTYQARHKHFRGECKGRLIIGADQVSYESLDAIGHSRRWDYKSIKETKLSNPYELDITPFDGAAYKLLLDAPGMAPATYQSLVDRVVAARTKPEPTTGTKP
jgi:hypothetical protein